MVFTAAAAYVPEFARYKSLQSMEMRHLNLQEPVSTVDFVLVVAVFHPTNLEPKIKLFIYN